MVHINTMNMYPSSLPGTQVLYFCMIAVKNGIWARMIAVKNGVWARFRTGVRACLFERYIFPEREGKEMLLLPMTNRVYLCTWKYPYLLGSFPKNSAYHGIIRWTYAMLIHYGTFYYKRILYQVHHINR